MGSKKVKASKKRNESQKHQLLLFSLIFAVAVVSYFLLNTFAAISSVGVEAEVAIPQPDATIKSLNTASNNQFIEFSGTSNNPPTGCNIPENQLIAGFNPDIRSAPIKPTFGETVENFIVSASTHGIENTGGNNLIRNGAILQQNGDNIKLSSGSTYESLYLEMASTGGHIDAMQNQGHTNVTIRNVKIIMNDPTNVTAAIFMDTKLGGSNAGAPEVTFTIDCVDITVTNVNKPAIYVGNKDYPVPVDATITNVTTNGEIRMRNDANGPCTIHIDAQSRQYLTGFGCDVIDIP